MRARSRSIAPCRSALAREHGGHRNHLNRFVRKRTPTAGAQRVHEGVPLPPVGARLRANTAGTERSNQVRPQADSYSGRPMRTRSQFIAPCRSSLASERGVHRTTPLSPHTTSLARESGDKPQQAPGLRACPCRHQQALAWCGPGIMRAGAAKRRIVANRRPAQAPGRCGFGRLRHLRLSLPFQPTARRAAAP